MKFLSLIFIYFISLQAQAHQDHYLGDGLMHNLVHAILTFLLIAVAVTGVKWLSKKIQQSQALKK